MATARTHQRRLAVLAVLHEEGPCYASELEKAVRAWPGTLYAVLAFLEREAGLIVAEMERPGPGAPPRAVYRIANNAERLAHNQRLLRAAKADAS